MEPSTTSLNTSSETNISPNSPIVDLSTKKQKRNIVATGLGLGLIYNWLFYDQYTGISYMLYMLLFYAAIYFLKLPGKLFSDKKDWLYLGSVLSLTATFGLFANPILYSLNKIVVPLLILSHLCELSNGGRKISEAYLIRKPLELLSNTFKETKSYLEGTLSLFNFGFIKNPIFRKVFTGLFISLPIFILLTVLLASADQIFSQKLDAISQFLIELQISEILRRGFNIAVVGSLLALIFFSAFTLKNNEEKLNLKIVWDSITINTILSLLNLLFLAFCLIQITYLFADNSYNASINYAFYARKGFFELCVVTLINFGILLSTLTFTDKSSKLKNRILQVELSLLIVQTGLILVSAFYRMYLYENAYGFTYLRFFTHYFMIMLFLLLIASLVKVCFTEVPLIKYFIRISLSAYILLNFVNTDRIIAELNLSKQTYTGLVDLRYLTTLSTDAYPVLIEYCNDDKTEKHTKERLSEFFAKIKSDNSKLDYNWQEFNLSRYLANKSINAGF